MIGEPVVGAGVGVAPGDDGDDGDVVPTLRILLAPMIVLNFVSECATGTRNVRVDKIEIE